MTVEETKKKLVNRGDSSFIASTSWILEGNIVIESLQLNVHLDLKASGGDRLM